MGNFTTGVMRRGAPRARARAVGSFVPTLTRKAFERYGFSTAALLTEWATIAGDELASYTVPERLTWPKSSAQSDIVEERGRGEAKLVLRVDTARVLDVEYRKHQIIERINAHFGYRAVAELRFIQAPVLARQTPIGMRAIAGRPRDVVRVASRAAETGSSSINAPASGLPELEAALSRLGESVRARR